MKHASNAFRVSSYRQEVRSKVKKLSWFQRTLLCMNIDIRKGQYENYKSNKKILRECSKWQNEDEAETAAQESDDTLSYGAWSKGRVNWDDFEDTASGPSTAAGPSSSIGRRTGSGQVDYREDDDDEDEASEGSDEDFEE